MRARSKSPPRKSCQICGELASGKSANSCDLLECCWGFRGTLKRAPDASTYDDYAGRGRFGVRRDLRLPGLQGKDDFEGDCGLAQSAADGFYDYSRSTAVAGSG